MPMTPLALFKRWQPMHKQPEAEHHPADLLFASIVHEIRSPIAIIMGFAELLEDGAVGPLSHGQVRYITKIREGAQDIERLVNDVLDLVKLERGDFTLDSQGVPARELAYAVAEAFEAIAQKRLVELSVDVPVMPQLEADPIRLKQVLYNLVSNALKFTPEGGRVLIQARRQRDMVAFSVADTGIGIPAEALPNLFQGFYQVKPTCGGSGLGLMIAKRLVEAHHGTIFVESRLDAGTTFTFTIPLRTPDPLPRRATMRLAPSPIP
ncbi:MAG TPA: HAMP domain-containing sensor histidine kinase [Stenomitos sp.]